MVKEERLERYLVLVRVKRHLMELLTIVYDRLRQWALLMTGKGPFVNRKVRWYKLTIHLHFSFYTYI